MHRILEALDKGKAAAITTIVETRVKATGELIFENQSTVFIRGAGGFNGKRSGIGNTFRGLSEMLYELFIYLCLDRGPASAANNPPKRAPDAIVEERTSPSQAALYRYGVSQYLVAV